MRYGFVRKKHRGLFLTTVAVLPIWNPISEFVKWYKSHKLSQHCICICGHLCQKHLNMFLATAPGDMFLNVIGQRWPIDVFSSVFDHQVSATGSDIIWWFLKLFLVPFFFFFFFFKKAMID
ncbi:PREDICTED: protein PAPPAS [Rhinopithecus bieti]|uniref:protein PAPPAS n=1 Tax=Rhinopithecus bieti TaxID=61621 RepID=UPI00083C10C7|nr:PREDICTED: protein PAPPAS [Rhinopithecus bieti]